MLSHSAIWSAIDRLAAGHGLSASALARLAGLDPTSFNRSKRIARDGRPRWPSTESIAKVLQATGTSLAGFLRAADGTGAVRALPLLGLARAGGGGFFTDGGFPVGAGWEEIAFPGGEEGAVYALRVTGDSMMPLYRAGDVIIVSPAAASRSGDRVVVKTVAGEVLAKVLARRTDRTLELASLNPDHPVRMLPIAEVEWIARILWASQ